LASSGLFIWQTKVASYVIVMVQLLGNYGRKPTESEGDNLD